MPICKNCNKEFPNKLIVNNKTHLLIGRTFCPDCSPLGSNNTRSYIVKFGKNESFCARCKEIKPKKDFYKRKNGSSLSYCKECQEIVKQLKFEENLQHIIEERGGQCVDCKLSFPYTVYTFFSDTNIYQLNKARNMSLDNIKEDLKNYTMLCLNCCAIRQWVKK
jgi:hypothetical protein